MIPFLITIDTEGDNLWDRPQVIKTENAKWLPRFQELCVKYGFKPTYLTNYEMANDNFFQSFGHDVLRSDTGEIGMHLHAWNSPPIIELTDNDYKYQPYLIEYNNKIIRDKIIFLTDFLENIFSQKMTSHRAGRWAINEYYTQLLVEFGYTVDCSVTPGISWSAHKGDPSGLGGSDYSFFPDEPYFLNTEEISCSGNSTLLEMPVTINAFEDFSFIAPLRKIRGIGGALTRRYPNPAWIRPNGFNVKSMLRTIDKKINDNASYIQFMLHSSELMPGGCARFKDEKSIEKLYTDLEALFYSLSKRCNGMTLTEYRNSFVGG